MTRRPSISPTPSYDIAAATAPAQTSPSRTTVHKHQAAGRPSTPPSARAADPSASAKTRQGWPVGEVALTVAIAGGLAAAWYASAQGELSAGQGTGYYLGITGSLMMVSLLLYPLRKYWSRMGSAGAVRHWFNLHVVLGLVGPALVVAPPAIRSSPPMRPWRWS